METTKYTRPQRRKIYKFLAETIASKWDIAEENQWICYLMEAMGYVTRGVNEYGVKCHDGELTDKVVTEFPEFGMFLFNDEGYVMNTAFGSARFMDEPRTAHMCYLLANEARITALLLSAEMCK